MERNVLDGKLYKKVFFGKLVAHLIVIEAQGQGLPHTHILAIRHRGDRRRTVKQMDKMGVAAIPIPTNMIMSDFQRKKR